MFRSKRLQERNEGLSQFKEIIKSKKEVLIIHYSCESFITSHGKTPRVTSISVRNLATGQSKSFSIHLQAQFNNKDFENLTEEDYDLLEKQLLDEFYEYAEVHRECKWLHWNMRDSNYGFEAIANRYRILGGNSFEIHNNNRYDLPRIIGQIYTYGYENNKPKGRLLNLAESNAITTKDALTGAEEAVAFDTKEYLKLHMSTLRKTDIIETIVYKIENNTLKVKSSWKDIYGLSISGIIEIVKNSWILSFLWTVIMIILGAAGEPIIQKIFGTNK